MDPVERIKKLHGDVHKWFFVSVPGLIWLGANLLQEFESGRLGVLVDNIKNKQPVTDDVGRYLLTYVIPFVCWWIPFETAENAMSKMKSAIRSYGSVPIAYTPVDKLVNRIMSIAHDRTPLPRFTL